jgi:hypothetical protein
MTTPDEVLAVPSAARDALPHDADGTPLVMLDECPEGGFFDLDQWLPAQAQMKSALRLDLDDAIHGSPAYRAELGPCPATSMRHGWGMIMLTALIAGALPFIVDWIRAASAGTIAPFMGPASMVATSDTLALSENPDIALLVDAAQSIAGLAPWLPVWLAAGLSALGHWVSWPLEWLTLWIVYGVVTLAVSHLFGARTTLQHFFAGTSYACLPLLLLALTPIPYLGPLAALVAVIWALIVYVLAVENVAKFDLGRAIVSALAPGALLLLLFLLGFGAAALSALRVTAF